MRPMMGEFVCVEGTTAEALTESCRRLRERPEGATSMAVLCVLGLQGLDAFVRLVRSNSSDTCHLSTCERMLF